MSRVWSRATVAPVTDVCTRPAFWSQSGYQRVPGWKPWWPRLQLVAQQWPNATTVKRLGTLPFPPLKALRCSSHALKHPDLRPYLVQCTLTATHIHGTTTANRTEHASSTQDVPAVDCHHHLCRRSHYFLTFCPGCVLRISSSEAFRWHPTPGGLDTPARETPSLSRV